MQNYLTKGTRLQDTYLIEGAIYEKKDRIGYLATYPDGQVLLEEYYSKDLAEREADSLTVRPLNEARFLSGMERFEKEGKALCELAREEERGIIRCLGAFRENGTAYLVYERKNGVTLDAYIRKNGPVSSDTLPIQGSIEHPFDRHRRSSSYDGGELEPDERHHAHNGLQTLCRAGAVRRRREDRSVDGCVRARKDAALPCNRRGDG